jgi:predicted aldo/keto reductase-like oxidoreductase
MLKEAAPNKSIASWSFRWLMGLDGVQTVLSGMTDEAVMADNLATFNDEMLLSETERKTLDQVKEAYLSCMGVPCSGCRYCCDECPAVLDIPKIMGMYNEYGITNDTWRFSNMGGDKGPADCLQCGACMTHCPQGIDIPGIMLKMQEIMESK